MIRVLVVDDSEVMRRLVTHILEADPDLTVVDTAADGEQAVRLTALLRPDVVSMDLVMPGMDGFEATRRIMQATPVPIVMVSASFNPGEVERTFRAISLGALAAVDKPTGPGDPRYEEKARELRNTIRLMSEVKVVGRRYPVAKRSEAAPTRSAGGGAALQAVGVGASTGGPHTLEMLLRALPGTFSLPVLVVQHIAPGFTRGLADWLRGATGRDVRLAVQDEPLAAGRCYVAPSGTHMEVTRELAIALRAQPPENGLRPSVDHLFRSLAAACGSRAVGVLLTGMGQDGAAGLLAMREKGALTIAQDAESSVVAGMPLAAVRLGAAALVLPPEKIAAKLAELDMTAGRGNRLAQDGVPAPRETKR